MVKQDIKIYLKNTPSECNKELLEFLHRNVSKISKYFTLNATVVTKKINQKLPHVKIDGEITIGKKAIINLLKSLYVSKVQPSNNKENPIDDDDVIRSFMSKQLESGDNETEDRASELSKKLAAGLAPKTNSNYPKKQPVKNNISKSSLSSVGQKPSEFESDPMMAKFWANQGL